MKIVIDNNPVDEDVIAYHKSGYDRVLTFKEANIQHLRKIFKFIVVDEDREDSFYGITANYPRIGKWHSYKDYNSNVYFGVI